MAPDVGNRAVSSSSFAPSASSTSSTAAPQTDVSNAAPSDPTQSGPIHPSADELKISIATWNVNGQMPPTFIDEGKSQDEHVNALAAWLRAEEESDIIVVG
jgi:hypothetical protein